MTSKYKMFIQDKELITKRVTEWIGTYSKGDICSMLGVTRPTLDTRLKLNNWKMKEIDIIFKKMPF